MTGVRTSRGAAVVAEDDPQMLGLMAILMRKIGFDVFTAADGKACLDLLNKVQPKIIVLDINMPVMNGLEAAAEIARRPDRKSIPILFVTTESGRETIQAAAETGCAGYLIKPFSPSTFAEKIEACMRMRAKLRH